MYVCMYVCMYVGMYVYIYIHIYIYIYIQICMFKQLLLLSSVLPTQELSRPQGVDCDHHLDHVAWEAGRADRRQQRLRLITSPRWQGQK